jgi:GcrA cell cycle regulator
MATDLGGRPLAAGESAAIAMLFASGLGCDAVAVAAGRTASFVRSMRRHLWAGPALTPAARALLLVDEQACRWPSGDPRDEGFSFCGERTERGQSFCSEHREAAVWRPSR